MSGHLSEYAQRPAPTAEAAQAAFDLAHAMTDGEGLKPKNRLGEFIALLESNASQSVLEQFVEDYGGTLENWQLFAAQMMGTA